MVKRRSDALQQNVNKRRMSVERRRDLNFHSPVRVGELFHNRRQIALEMNSQCQEVRHYQDSSYARIGQAPNRLGQTGLGFEKGRLNVLEPAGAGHCFRDSVHRFVSRFDA